jgi:3-hydroxyisobutyrate dehydrogenase-like beta-hydroxyacid dehydrogenase
MTKINTVGLLGLGKMGCPMAKHIIARGYRVVGYDPLPDACRAGAAVGACIAGSPREVAQASDLVVIVVGFDSEVEAVLYGKDGVLDAARPGLVVAVGSTIAPRTAVRLAARAAGQGVVLLDIPLTRGEAAAQAESSSYSGRNKILRGVPPGFELRVGHLPSGRPARRRRW